ncbi:MAG: GFA family protein [Pseudomonadota bacterium]
MSAGRGGCYCGALRYAVTAKPVFKAQCHCRPCQYASGGGPNYFMLIPASGVAITGTAQRFARADLENPVTRVFCPTCGTQVCTERADLGMVVLRVGTLDDPSVFGAPKAAIHMSEAQAFHCVADGVPQFDGLPQ